MIEELKATINDQAVSFSKNIIIYSTDEEMRQLRDILTRIVKRYRNDELPPLAGCSGEETEKSYQISGNLPDSKAKKFNQQQFTSNSEKRKAKVEDEAEIFRILKKMPIRTDAVPTMSYILDHENYFDLLLDDIFKYGVIVGKQEERKKHNENKSWHWKMCKYMASVKDTITFNQYKAICHALGVPLSKFD